MYKIDEKWQKTHNFSPFFYIRYFANLFEYLADTGRTFSQRFSRTFGIRSYTSCIYSFEFTWSNVLLDFPMLEWLKIMENSKFQSFFSQTVCNSNMYICQVWFRYKWYHPKCQLHQSQLFLEFFVVIGNGQRGLLSYSKHEI